MNKKFSTLMAGLLLAGGLTNLAFAEKLPYTSNIGKDFKSGDSYFLVNDFGTAGLFVYGFEEDPNNKDVVIEKVISLTDENLKADEYKNYLWTVSEVTLKSDITSPANTDYGYTLTNVATGKKLIFNTDGTVDTNTANDATQTSLKETTIWFGPGADAYKTLTSGQSAYIGQTYPAGNPLAMFATNELKTTANLLAQNHMYFYGYEAQDQSAEELNELYNSIGFNMYVDGKDKDAQAAIKNLFATSGRVLALEVGNVQSPNYATDKSYYPAGTYFVTNVPTDRTWESVKDDNNKAYAFLEECTFIAVNSVANEINGKTQRENGDGFQLTTVLGRNMTKRLENGAVPTGRDIAATNACFKVKKDVNDKYTISLEKFWYNKAEASKIEEKSEQTPNSNYCLAVTEVGGEAQEGEFLTTFNDASKAAKFIMKDIATTSVFKWLKNEKKMSAYNIQFVSDNDDINGKYLFVPAYGDKAYAKGVKFTDTNMPETQFVVTDVDADNNTVTFTNRANRDMNEKVKIYAEADGTYTIALENKAGEFAPLNVLSNGDIEQQDDVKLHGLRVNITPVENVDYFYGAWDVDNGEEVTLLFARDNTPTSNKLYVKHPGYDKTDPKHPTLKTDALKVTDNVEGTLQFALKKSEKPVIKTYGYAYYLGETGKEQEKWEANGDTIAYYTYQLEAYYEGEPSGQYLTWSSDGYKLTNKGTEGLHFIIKDNQDGSVQLINNGGQYNDGYAVKTSLLVNNWEQTGWTIDKLAESNIVDEFMGQVVLANYVKTYLNLESPEVSLDPKSTYVTFKAEEGDYITMKDDRDAVLVSDQPLTFRVFATDTEREVPNFLVSTGWNDNTRERMFLFNPTDSVDYYVAEGDYDKTYQWSEGINKAIFKSARMAESCDTLYTTIKGNATAVATVADQNKNVQGGLNYFKYQIVEDPETEGYYLIRQNGYFLTSTNGRMGFTKAQGARDLAVRVDVANVDAPTANETINAANNVVVAGVNGAVVVKGAEGKNVVVSTILGKVVANEVVSSDNATIATPAGIVVVSVDGESFKVVVK